jgi:hypothetical protein
MIMLAKSRHEIVKALNRLRNPQLKKIIYTSPRITTDPSFTSNCKFSNHAYYHYDSSISSFLDG